MAPRFHELKILDVKPETEGAVSISFDVPENLLETFNFLPGQYLTVRTMMDGEEIRRSYSICSAVSEGLRIGVKQVPSGKFSTFAQTLQAGDTLEVMPPEGRFVADPDEKNSNHFQLIAAGSGITPVLSIAKSVLQNEPGSTVTLVYGNRTTASIMFREELENLKDRFLERFHVYHVLSREAQDVDLFAGRIDAEKIDLLCVNIWLSASHAWL